MIDAAILTFLAAAITGGAMTLRITRRRRFADRRSATIHGLLAAAGLIVLAIAVTDSEFQASAVAAAAFMLGAILAGMLLLLFHRYRLRQPESMIVGHVLLSTAGLLALLRAAGHIH